MSFESSGSFRACATLKSRLFPGWVTSGGCATSVFAFQLGHKVHDEGSDECRGGNWDPTEIASHQIKELKDVKITFHGRTPKSPPLIAPSEVEVAYYNYTIFIFLSKLDFSGLPLELRLDQ